MLRISLQLKGYMRPSYGTNDCCLYYVSGFTMHRSIRRMEKPRPGHSFMVVKVEAIKTTSTILWLQGSTLWLLHAPPRHLPHLKAHAMASCQYPHIIAAAARSCQSRRSNVHPCDSRLGNRRSTGSYVHLQSTCELQNACKGIAELELS
jgi:hypothetical protein